MTKISIITPVYKVEQYPQSRKNIPCGLMKT